MDTQSQPPTPQPPVQEPAPQPPEPRPPFNEVSVLFPLLSLVTVVYLGMLVAEFILHDAAAAVHVPAPMMPIYISLLGAYAADKEIRRWVGTPEPPRKGVIFVYLWVLLFLILAIINFFRTDYPLPSDISKVVLQVLGVFFGSRTSKYIHERKSAAAALNPAELTARQTRILEIIRTNGKVTRAEVSKMFDLGKSAATNLLEAMVQDGLIRRAGESRETHYLAVEPKK